MEWIKNLPRERRTKGKFCFFFSSLLFGYYFNYIGCLNLYMARISGVMRRNKGLINNIWVLLDYNYYN